MRLSRARVRPKRSIQRALLQGFGRNEQKLLIALCCTVATLKQLGWSAWQLHRRPGARVIVVSTDLAVSGLTVCNQVYEKSQPSRMQTCAQCRM